MIETSQPIYSYHELFPIRAWMGEEDVPAGSVGELAEAAADEGLGAADHYREMPPNAALPDSPASSVIPLFAPDTMRLLDGNLRHVRSDRRFRADPDIIETLEGLNNVIDKASLEAKPLATAVSGVLIVALAQYHNMDLIFGGRAGFRDLATAERFQSLIAAMTNQVITYLGWESGANLTADEAREMINLWISHCHVAAGPLRTAELNRELHTTGDEATAVSLYSLISDIGNGDAGAIANEAEEILDGLAIRLKIARQRGHAKPSSPARVRTESAAIGLALRILSLIATPFRRR